MMFTLWLFFDESKAHVSFGWDIIDPKSLLLRLEHASQIIKSFHHYHMDRSIIMLLGENVNVKLQRLSSLASERIMSKR